MLMIGEMFVLMTLGVVWFIYRLVYDSVRAVYLLTRWVLRWSYILVTWAVASALRFGWILTGGERRLREREDRSHEA